MISDRISSSGRFFRRIADRLRSKPPPISRVRAGARGANGVGRACRAQTRPRSAKQTRRYNHERSDQGRTKPHARTKHCDLLSRVGRPFDRSGRRLPATLAEPAAVV